MKEKGALLLMEQLFMVLLFSVAAVFCLQTFLLSEQISAKGKETNEALRTVQSTAEALKASQGDVEKAAAYLGLDRAGDGWSDGTYRISVEPVSDGTAGLGKARVSAFGEEGEELAGLVVAWQEMEEK